MGIEEWEIKIMDCCLITQPIVFVVQGRFDITISIWNDGRHMGKQCVVFSVRWRSDRPAKYCDKHSSDK